MAHSTQRRTNNPRNVIFTFSFLILFITLYSNLAFSISPLEKSLITINKFVSHPALDAVENGIMQALHDRNLSSDQIVIKVDNAQGNIANSIQIAKYHASIIPKVMVAIATPAAQANFKAAMSQPSLKQSLLAFAAVTDPKTAGIIGSQSQVIGVTDQPPIPELMTKVKEVFPNIKTLGVIFNPGEINSVQMVETIEQLALSKRIAVKKVTVTSSVMIVMAMQKLCSEVELIYLPQDNTVIAGIESIVKISLRAKIPVIANDPSLTDKGVMLAIGADYFSMGLQLGNMIADRLAGKEIAHPIQVASTKELKINYEIAAALGIEVNNE